MRWMWGGAVCALAFGGCAHEQAKTAQAEPAETWRQPVAGRESTEGAVLQPKGQYQVKQGEYRSPQGEYFRPEGVYGQRGKITTEGEIFTRGTYGTYVKPEGTVQRPTGIEAQPEGTYYRRFGSSEMSERQPVAGRDAQYLFVRDEHGRTWQVSDPAVISRVEKKLSEQGCNPGNLDGRADQEFAQGLLQCQQKLGLQATGVIDQATARSLGLDFAELCRGGHMMR